MSDPSWIISDSLYHHLNFVAGGHLFKPKNLKHREDLIRALETIYGMGRKDFQREFRQMIGAMYNESD